jgi:hypothetical protein
MTFCGSCGKPVERGSRHCANCGIPTRNITASLLESAGTAATAAAGQARQSRAPSARDDLATRLRSPSTGVSQPLADHELPEVDTSVETRTSAQVGVLPAKPSGNSRTDVSDPVSPKCPTCGQGIQPDNK